jgi:hypothetical protein
MEEKKEEIKLSLSDALKFIKEKGYSPEAVIRFKKQSLNRRLTSKQVERALMSHKRDKLRSLCHNVAATGHGHIYLSVMGDKVVLTGVDQLKANLKPFNRRGFGSAKHALGARGASLIGQAKAKKKPFLSRLTPEQRSEISRRGGLASAKKRADKAAMRKKRGPHWTQRPENREKVLALTSKATAAKKSKKAAA